MKLASVAVEADEGTDVELSPSVIRILGGALDMIAARGVKRLTMSDIIDASGVSRGTLYRYFSNKDEVMAAVAEYVCSGFENGVREAGEGIEDPIERLKAVMAFYARYTDEHSPGPIFAVEPAFHLAFFRSRFARYKQAVIDALEPTFAHLDELVGEPVNREAFAEMMVRSQLSTLLVPADDDWKQIWNASADRVQKWALAIAASHS